MTRKIIICILLIFFTANLRSQQVVRLCSDERTTYRYFTDSNLEGSYSWFINGFSVGDSSNEIFIDWTNYEVGDYIIEVNQESDDFCNSNTRLIRISLIECPNSSIWFPNSFTPNSDGINDMWFPSTYNIEDLTVYVFNRWGELIFTSKNLNNRWNGTYRGEECSVGVYVFSVFWTDEFGIVKNKIGKITLIR